MNEYLNHFIKQNDIESIKNIIKDGVDLNLSSDENKKPIYVACKHANVDVIKLLLENGAKVNQGKDSLISVIYAYKKLDSVEKDFIEITKLLLAHGADPNHENSKGNTILDYISHDEVDFIECMIKGGFDIYKANKNGETLKERTVGKEIFDVALKIEMMHKNSLNNTNTNDTKRTRLRSI